VERFAAAGLDFSAVLDKDNRQLMVPTPCGRARALLVRNGDVPTYVSYGQAQLGVVGYDVLKEHQLPVAQLVDLGFGGCRMSVAVKATSGYQRALDLPAHCRVASKFTHCAREYFDALDLPVELVHLNGSVELGPITGMSEAIVDLVATGRTLRDNGLVEIEELFRSSARLVGHPLSMRLDDGALSEIVTAIRTVTAPKGDA
jgi:ATP phosphoribosyltransferase